MNGYTEEDCPFIVRTYGTQSFKPFFQETDFQVGMMIV